MGVGSEPDRFGVGVPPELVVGDDQDRVDPGAAGELGEGAGGRFDFGVGRVGDRRRSLEPGAGRVGFEVFGGSLGGGLEDGAELGPYVGVDDQLEDVVAGGRCR